MRPEITWVAAGVFFCSPAIAQPAPLDCSAKFDELFAQATAQGRVTANGPQFVVVEKAGETEVVLFYFTTPNEKSHPAVVRQTAWAAGDQTRFDLSGCGYGDKSEFEELMKKHQAFFESMQGTEN